jgi:hypothetical protein
MKNYIFWGITPFSPLKVISQKIELFITTAVRTSNPMQSLCLVKEWAT